MRKSQAGTTAVEFAIGGAVSLILLIGCIEIARAFYVWNTIGEATRRAARLAAVCPIGSSAIPTQAMVVANGDGSSSTVLNGLTTANVTVSYLDASNADTTDYGAVKYVRVQISGYVHELLIPYFNTSITVPPFATTLPAESMGWVPELNTRICL